MASFSQGGKLFVGVKFGPEATTGVIKHANLKPLDLYKDARITYRAGLQFRGEFLPWLGFETGFYRLDRGSGTVTTILNDWGNPIGYRRLSFHYQYLSIPLALRLQWKEAYFRAGPNIEFPLNAFSIEDGIRKDFRPNTSPFEVGLHFGFGLETQIWERFHGFLELNVDPQLSGQVLAPNAIRRHIGVAILAGFSYRID